MFLVIAEKSSDLYMGGETRPFLRGIDVNRSPLSSAAADNNDDEAALSSPNSTVSSVSGKRSVADAGGGGDGDEHDGERDSSSRAAAVSDEEEGEGSRKKLRLTKDQSAVLEESFKEHNSLNPVRARNRPKASIFFPLQWSSPANCLCVCRRNKSSHWRSSSTSAPGRSKSGSRIGVQGEASSTSKDSIFSPAMNRFGEIEGGGWC